MSDADAVPWDRGFVRQHFVGVIDLRRDQAVHAVKGDRENYADVQCVRGNPLQLARAYADFGICNIYIADLDAIQHQSEPSSMLGLMIESLDPETEFLIDIGWRGNETLLARNLIRTLAIKSSRTSWIAASETAESLSALPALYELVPECQVLAGLDYRGSQWISEQISEADCLDNASKLALYGAVVLDLKSVGSGSGPSTAQRCRELKSRFPNWRIISGGGIRCPSDARILIEAGCEKCLLATAIHPFLNV